MKGLVYNKTTKKVLYKFDTETYPAITADEEIILRDDINDIEANADINPDTGEYINPPVAPRIDYQALYLAATTDQDKMSVLAKYVGLDPDATIKEIARILGFEKVKEKDMV